MWSVTSVFKHIVACQCIGKNMAAHFLRGVREWATPTLKESAFQERCARVPGFLQGGAEEARLTAKSMHCAATSIKEGLSGVGLPPRGVCVCTRRALCAASRAAYGALMGVAGYLGHPGGGDAASWCGVAVLPNSGASPGRGRGVL